MEQKRSFISAPESLTLGRRVQTTSFPVEAFVRIQSRKLENIFVIHCNGNDKTASMTTLTVANLGESSQAHQMNWIKCFQLLAIFLPLLIGFHPTAKSFKVIA